MMDINLPTLLSFVFVTTLTPGPNNITSASMGVLHGYRKTLNYIFGICTGFFFVMLLSGRVSAALLNVFPSFEQVLRFIGAGYILWLAYHTLRASYVFDEKEQKILGYSNGLLLQVLNPKVIVYGLKMFTTFLVSITQNIGWMLAAEVSLAGMAFFSTSTWTLFGAGIRNYLRSQKIRRFVNTVLSLLLVYTAIELSGLLP